MSAKVAFIDDYEISRKVFSGLFAHIPEVELVLACHSGEEFLKAMPNCEIHIAVVDLIMPGMNGVETIAAIKQLNPSILCIGISSHDKDELMLQTVDAGAVAYLSKEANLAEFRKVFIKVIRGETCYPPRLRELLEKRS